MTETTIKILSFCLCLTPNRKSIHIFHKKCVRENKRFFEINMSIVLRERVYRPLFAMSEDRCIYISLIKK